MTTIPKSNAVEPQGYYLYVTPWLAYGHLRRPCWVLRVIQRVFLGWRWCASQRKFLSGMLANSPDSASEPYALHLPEVPGLRVAYNFSAEAANNE